MRARSDQRGESLLEVLIAVAIAGLAVAGLLGLMGTTIFASRVHRHQATATTLLLSAVENVKAVPYQPCATSATVAYVSAAQAVATPSGYSVSIPANGVQYWNGSAFQSSPCNDNVDSLLRMQLVTVQVKSPGGQAVESLSLVKRG